MNRRSVGLCVAGLLCCVNAAADSVPSCPPDAGAALQVLGSGGPIADDARASSAYIVWVDKQSRVLIDAGGGMFLRFGEAGADFLELDVVGLSHYHTDHSADFPALLKSGNFSRRERPLTVAGPAGNRRFPSLEEFLDALLAPGSGAYAYLSGYLDGTAGLARLNRHEVAVSESPASVFESAGPDLSVTAMRVPHGIVPAAGFRVTSGETSIVFASDQNGSDPTFVEFAKDTDILVMHMPIPEAATGGALELHARPGTIGRIASRANAKTLVLSHFMARSLRNFDANLAAVRAEFDGRLVVAEDLACILP